MLRRPPGAWSGWSCSSWRQTWLDWRKPSANPARPTADRAKRGRVVRTRAFDLAGTRFRPLPVASHRAARGREFRSGQSANLRFEMVCASAFTSRRPPIQWGRIAVSFTSNLNEPARSRRIQQASGRNPLPLLGWPRKSLRPPGELSATSTRLTHESLRALSKSSYPIPGGFAWVRSQPSGRISAGCRSAAEGIS